LHNTLVEINPSDDCREMTCDVQLDPGRTIKGTLVDPDGKPVEGVRIMPSWGLGGGTREVGKSADFTLRTVDTVNPRAYFFEQRERKLGAVVLFKDAKTDKVVIKLEKHGVIKGRLLDLEGEPLAKMTLSGYFEDGQFGIERGWGGFFWTATDKEGRFAIPVHAGIRLGTYLMPRPTRRGESLFRELVLKPGEVKDLGDVKRSASVD
jgi:hypothetical protein